MKDFITNKWTKYVAAFMATVALASTLWAAADYTETRPIIKKEFMEQSMVTEQTFTEQAAITEQHSQDLLRLRFDALYSKLEVSKILTFVELQTMCDIARQLGYVGITECFKMNLNVAPEDRQR